MNIKRISRHLRRCLLLGLMACSTLTTSAVPAKPGLVRTLQLSDGTTVTARLVGDEFGHFWLAENGKTYQIDATTNRFVDVDAEMVKTKATSLRNKANAQRASRLAAPRKVGQVGNYSGNKKGLIILVNFSDVKFKSTNNQALYKRIANEKNFSYNKFKGSMYDYFYAQSDGIFELTFDVAGPYDVSKSQSYYGSNDYWGDDQHPAEMVLEAVKKANADVNYADYDWDRDGYVDQVYVVYAGKGEADGGASYTIWPHAWSLSSAGVGTVTLDGKIINSYACGSELDGQTGTIAGIGTMCHEFSHCLGYPDFYDTDYSGGQGMGNWDLMDSGSYNGDGYQPCGYTAYERWMAGWKTPITLTSTTAVTGMKSLQDGGESYIIYNSGNSNEFYMLENRQLTGWDASLPGKGLLIVHVDYDESAWSYNKPNDEPSHQRMTWIPADNQYQYTTYQGTKYYTVEGMATDPFPYGSVNAFNKSTTPAATFYNKNANGEKYLDSSIENITQNADGTISFNFRGVSTVATPTISPAPGKYADPISVTITTVDEDATIYYTLDGKTPTTSSHQYTQPFNLTTSGTVKAIAVKDGDISKEVSATYIIGDYNGMTFKRVKSLDEMVSGMRYIIACGSKNTAAGIRVGSDYLKKVDVVVEDDIITLDENNEDDVLIYTLEGNGNSWSLYNDAYGYLYANSEKKVRFLKDEEKKWTLSNDNSGVIMSFTKVTESTSYWGTTTTSTTNCGTMLYNNQAPRFTTYTSNTNANMIYANLYIEYTPTSQRLLGDANGDGEVNVADVTMTVDYILSNGSEFEHFVFPNADIDGNGIISVTDVTAIVDIILGVTATN